MASVQGVGVQAIGGPLVTWTPITHADDGAAVSLDRRYADKTVQMYGTWAGGMSLTLEGSLDGNAWGTLTDAQGAPLTFTANGGPKTVLQNCIQYRITRSSGSASSVTVLLLATRTS